MAGKKYLNADIFGRVNELKSSLKQFEIRTKLYRTLLKGRGLEFESYRDFAPDDDSFLIDWKASVRANKPLIRQYTEEKNLKIIFAVDVGENMVSGSAEKLKCEYAAEVVGSLAHLIIDYGDMVGFLLFSDEIKQFIPPARDKNHFNLFMSFLLNPEIYTGTSDISVTLDFAAKSLNKSISSLILVSDFLSFSESCKKSLSMLGSNFETFCLMIKDNIDKTLPEIDSEVVIEDPRTGQQAVLNPAVARKIYERHAREQENFFREECEKNNIDVLSLMTDISFVPELSQFIRRRVAGGI